MSLTVSGLRLPLAHFSLEIDADLTGRVTAIFGASGAGKSSLLEVVAGLRRPLAGEIAIDGDVITHVASGVYVRPEKRGVGYVPQEGALFPHLSVRQNILYGFKESPARPAALTPTHVTEVMEIDALLDRRIGTLSGGEQRRVALARALVSGPRLLLLDEPLAGLDAPLRDRLLPYFGRIRDEFAIPMLYVTHDPDEVMALCDDVVILTAGKI